MSPAEILAAVGPCPKCVAVQPDPSLTFYQAATAVFAVLLLTGVAGEIRSIRERMATEEPGETMPRPLRLQLIGITALLIFAMAGELLAVHALVTQSPHEIERVAVTLLLATTVTGIPLLMLWSLAEHRRKELRGAVQVVLGGLLVLLAAVTIYLIIGSIDRGPKTYGYHVYGTCAAGACGLNERERPSVMSEPLGQLRDGDEVEIVCQKQGEAVEAPNGRTSKVWDKLSNGAYVSDVAVDTPPVGNAIPACDKPPPGSPHSG